MRTDLIALLFQPHRKQQHPMVSYLHLKENEETVSNNRTDNIIKIGNLYFLRFTLLKIILGFMVVMFSFP